MVQQKNESKRKFGERSDFQGKVSVVKMKTKHYLKSTGQKKNVEF